MKTWVWILILTLAGYVTLGTLFNHFSSLFFISDGRVTIFNLHSCSGYEIEHKKMFNSCWCIDDSDGDGWFIWIEACWLFLFSRRENKFPATWGLPVTGTYLSGMYVLLSHVWLFETPWTVACQAPLSTEFSRQESCSGLPFLSPGIFLTQGLNSGIQNYRQILDCLRHQGGPLVAAQFSRVAAHLLMQHAPTPWDGHKALHNLSLSVVQPLPVQLTHRCIRWPLLDG